MPSLQNHKIYIYLTIGQQKAKRPLWLFPAFFVPLHEINIKDFKERDDSKYDWLRQGCRSIQGQED
jgi:hypothetical protein